MTKRVRVDFDLEAETYEEMKSQVDQIFGDGNVAVSNWVIQSPLCQEDFETPREPGDTQEAA